MEALMPIAKRMVKLEVRVSVCRLGPGTMAPLSREVTNQMRGVFSPATAMGSFFKA